MTDLIPDPVLEPYDHATDFDVRTYCLTHSLWVSLGTNGMPECGGCMDDYLREEAEVSEGLARMEGRL